jgi:hypothetical protein
MLYSAPTVDQAARRASEAVVLAVTVAALVALYRGNELPATSG